MKGYGSQSMVAPLRRVIVKRPQEAFQTQENIRSQWQQLNFMNPPDLDRAIREHEQFVEILRSCGAEVLCLPADDRTGLDSIYTHDPAIITDQGAIVFQMGKEARRGEAHAMEDALSEWDVPILRWVDGNARGEGGDMVWVNSSTLLIGRGFRTNQAGIDRIRAILNPYNIVVIAFDLPYSTGPGDVLHEMSVVSMLDEDLAIVYRPLMPVALYELLQSLNIVLIDVANEEFNTLGCNVLAVAPREVVMVSGNWVTRRKLEAAGCRVHEFEGHEIALKGSGGPTCLTRPVLRS